MKHELKMGQSCLENPEYLSYLLDKPIHSVKEPHKCQIYFNSFERKSDLYIYERLDTFWAYKVNHGLFNYEIYRMPFERFSELNAYDLEYPGKKPYFIVSRSLLKYQKILDTFIQRINLISTE